MRVVTEEFAKTKTCPFSKAAGFRAGSPCEGSGCLAWYPEDIKGGVKLAIVTEGRCGKL